MSKWISVSEKLPEERYEDVLVVYKRKSGSRYRTVAWMNTYDGDWDCGEGFADSDVVTHWMPLPELPGEV